MTQVRIESNVLSVLQAIQELEEKVLTGVGLYVEGKAKEKITEMDAVDSGYLRNSLDNEVDKANKKVTIGTNCNYSIYVHEGTRRMRKRPFLKDGAFQNIPGIKRVAENIGRQVMS
jgi:hypothetical protein